VFGVVPSRRESSSGENLDALPLGSTDTNR
jgi:hypothetical protein